MWKTSALGLTVLIVVPLGAGALEVKNPRSAYGPFGATRTDNKFLPGDVLFIHYDIEGLAVNDKGKVNYYSELEFFDAKGTSISRKKNETISLMPDLGGKTFPGVLNAVMGEDQKPGKYKVKLKVVDLNAKKTAELEYPFELLPKGFGAIRVSSPGFGVPGGDYYVQMVLVELPLDAKKMPNVDLTMTVLEEGGKTPLSKPVVINYPKQLPDDANLQKQNLVPVVIPLYLFV